MSCSPNPCANGGTCSLVNDTTVRTLCTCADGFGGETCASALSEGIGVQVLAAIIASCATVLLICFIFAAAVTYSVCRKFKDRNSIHVRRHRGRSSRSKPQHYVKEYIDSQYDPEKFNPNMYENKAAIIAQRWDSKEELDSGFLGDKSTNGGHGNGSKPKLPNQETSMDISKFERSQKMRSTPKDAGIGFSTGLQQAPPGFEHWGESDNVADDDEEGLDLSAFTPRRENNSDNNGSSLLQAAADLY